MKLSFEDIENKASNKVGLLLAHGPSLKKDISRVFELSKNKDKFATFTTGEAIILENMGYHFDLDYWSIANTVFTVGRNFNDINKYKNVTFVYADSVDKTPNPEELLKCNFIAFDQRHFNQQNCKKNWKPGDHSWLPNGYYFCCNHLNDSFFIGKKTIQEYVRDKCNASEHYSTAATSALHALSTAIIAGCKEIYIFGVDLNYRLGYADSKTINNDSFDPHISDIVNDFRILTESASKIGIKIFNCNPNSPIASVVPTKEFDK